MDKLMPVVHGLVGKARQRGITSIEYALIGSLIGVAIVVGATALGDANSGMWNTMANTVKSALGLR